MCLIYIYVALASYNTGVLTLPVESIENIVDEKGTIAGVDKMLKNHEKARLARLKDPGQSRASSSKVVENDDWEQIWSIGTDAVLDVPIGGVCEILYGGRQGPSDIRRRS
jgi:phosphatidylinositol glycan class P protein